MSKNLYEMYATVDEFEIEGVWQELGDTRIKLARSGSKNTRYNKILKKVLKLHKKSLDSLSDKEQDVIMAEIFAKGVVTAWEVKEKGKWKSGILMPNDKGEMEIMPFNQKNVQKCLTDLPDLFTELREYAGDIKTFQAEVEEEQLKN